MPSIALTRAVRTRTARSTGGSDSARASAIPSCTDERRARLGAAARRTGRSTRSMPYGSTPRSKRADASLRSPSRGTDWAMPSGSNQAISSADDGRRVGDLAVEAAHDPADADGDVVAVADQQVLVREARGSAPSSVTIVSPSRGAPDAEPAATERLEVVRVVRLVAIEHHEVRHVDDVVDRAHPGQRQAVLHPRRRRLDLDAGDHGRREPTAAVAVDDGDGCRRAARRRWRARRALRTATIPSHAARSRATPEVAEAVRPVACDVEVEHDVLVDAERVEDRHAERRRRVEQQDPGVVLAETQTRAPSRACPRSRCRGSCAPRSSSRRGTLCRSWPAARRRRRDMLNAPHHTWRVSPSPASTYTRCTRSASGWRSVRSTFAVTMPGIGAPWRSTPSTARPVAFIAAASRVDVRRGGVAEVRVVVEPTQEHLHRRSVLSLGFLRTG